MPLLHSSFGHVLSNMLLSLLVSGYLERKYGSLALLVIIFGALGTSSFLAASIEDPCTVAVGASGVVFGIGASYIVDMVFNFASCSYPFVRLLGLLLFLVAFIVTIASSRAVSHLSHFGGTIGGLLPALLMQPALRSERAEAGVPYVVMGWAMVAFFWLPLYVYVWRIPGQAAMCG